MTTQTVLRQMPELENALKQRSPGLCLEAGALMARYTTLHLGGPADLLATPRDPEELQLLLEEARRLAVPLTLMGQGSNMLVRDGGIRGLVVRIASGMRGVEVHGDKVTAMAGATMTSAAMAAAENSLAGLTFASGIPGTVGGGAYMNAGAYGGEMSQVVVRVDAFRRDGSPVSFSRPELAFGYRHSALQQQDVAVYRVVFQLPGGDREELLQEMVELNRRRAEKQPLNYPSAGSTFKRPAGFYAAALIDECGLRGYTLGGAQVSEKHAGFLLNRGGTAADFLALMAHVQQVVWEKKGVRLEPEVRILGEDAPVTRA